MMSSNPWVKGTEHLYFLSYNMFTFNTYIPIGYAVFKVWSVKCLKITRIHFLCSRNLSIGFLIALDIFNMSLLVALNTKA